MPKLTSKEVIDTFISKHGSTYDYSKTVYENNLKEVVITCKTHGDFKQLPKVHKRCGCPQCGRITTGLKRKSNTEDFIDKSKKIHGTKYDYSNTIYKKANEKITIICKTHGQFEQTPIGHLGNRGCRQCSTEINSNKLRKTQDEFILEAKKIHGDTYDYSQVIYVATMEKVIIICKTHGPFEQTPNSHLSKGSGCRICSGCYKSNTEEFITKAQLIHGTNYDYSLVNYQTAVKKVTIVCKSHGHFELTPNHHLTGDGCFKCGHKMFIFSTEDFIKESNAAHSDLYDYTLSNYTKMQDKLTIICKEHGPFEQTPSNHINHLQGCGICGGHYKSNTNEFIEKAQLVHGEKYNYSKVDYTVNYENVVIVCDKHGDFLQTPQTHLSGSGCPTCTPKFSKAQINWLQFISLHDNIKHAENGGEYIIPGTRWKADGYCEETKTIYEFHGDFWHGNPKRFSQENINPISKKTFGELYKNTLMREQKIEELGYNLVVMWESDWNKLNRSVKTIQRKFRGISLNYKKIDVKGNLLKY